MTFRAVTSKALRYLIAAAFGTIAAIAMEFTGEWRYAPLVGWDIFAFSVIGMLLWDLKGHSDKEMQKLAARDDMNHSALDIIVITASIISLTSVFILLSGKSEKSTILLFHIGLGIVTIISSWLLLHLLYTVRYIVLYYRPNPGGIKFEGTPHPHFSDFIYFAFTIGMTYQVSDTTITTSKIRSVAIRHAILSYIFGTAIIAASINMIVSLGH